MDVLSVRFGSVVDILMEGTMSSVGSGSLVAIVDPLQAVMMQPVKTRMSDLFKENIK